MAARKSSRTKAAAPISNVIQLVSARPVADSPDSRHVSEVPALAVVRSLTALGLRLKSNRRGEMVVVPVSK